MDVPFAKKFRKDFRSWKQGVRLRRELKRYEHLFQSQNLSVPDDTDIRRIMKSRFPNLKPKSKGTLQIVAVYRHYNWENGSLKPSLEKFGSVFHYDWSERFTHTRTCRDRSVKREIADDLLSTLLGWTQGHSIDVVFAYVSGENVSASTVSKMRDMGIPMINMFLNDKEAFVGKIRKGEASGSRDICRYFDICWTSTADAAKKYCVEGALPIYLPEGANPDLHRPYEIEKTVDVSFVGQCYGNRPKIIQELKDRGIHVEVYGYGWPNGPLTQHDMVRMYSKSKVNLGFGEVGALQNTYCLKGRDFEVPMSGGLYLTEYHPELARCYDLGSEIVTYVDTNDLAEKIQYLLSNPEQADVIRKAGFRRARAQHTWEMRFEKVFRLMGFL